MEIEKKEKKYYKELNIIRILLCALVLLYHLNIIKNGFLAVCSFFILSGFLITTSSFNKEKFSFKDYYKNKLIKIYIPLLIVVFSTIIIISLIPSINWFNFKKEATSVLLNYNNYWQIGANLDYFSEHTSSPFMHFWYVSILMQLYLIFPLIFVSLRKLSEKVHKSIPIIILSLLSFLNIFYFYKMSISMDFMNVYYGTLCRSFSFVMGVLLAFLKEYYGSLIPKYLKYNYTQKLLFYFYLVLLVEINIFGLFNNNIIGMIVASIITFRLLCYGSIKSNSKNRIIDYISNLSYEIYLVQYPIIYIFQYLEINQYIKIIIIILLTIIISIMLNQALKLKNKKIISYVCASIFGLLTIGGIYKYITAKDYTDEMNRLKNQISQNEIMMQQKQQEYINSSKLEKEKYDEKISAIVEKEEELKYYVSNLHITAIGDSVMLGSLGSLTSVFPNGYYDAKISRTAWVANDILQNLKNRNMLSDIIVMNFGANGDCPESCKKAIMKTVENRKVFWLNTTNDNKVHVNGTLNKFAEKYDNLYIIDWNTISKGHSDYFIADGIHLTKKGADIYAKSIYDAIYNVYLDEYNKEKEKIDEEYNSLKQDKITLIGNEMLINAKEAVENTYEDYNIFAKKDYSFSELKEDLLNAKEYNAITSKIVFVFDNHFVLDDKMINEIKEICSESELYFALSYSVKYDNNIIDISDILSEDLMFDNIHLTDNGNTNLIKRIKDYTN